MEPGLLSELRPNMRVQRTRSSLAKFVTPEELATPRNGERGELGVA